MKKQIIVTLVVSCCLSWVLPGCSILEEPGEGSDVLKRRGVGTGGGDWTGIQAQDLAILLPREPEGAINAKTKTASGRNILPLHWVESVGDAFVDTDAGTALEEENRYAEWELVSIRVAPCSPLGHRPGAEAERICWPEVRLVWQPNQYNFHIGWTRVAEFSDDRAIHALYRAYPPGKEAEARSLIAEMQSAASGRGSTTTDRIDAFEAMRDEALESLLADVLALRQADTDPSEYENLDLRAETMGSDEERQAFYGGLRWFVGAYAEAEALHTLTAFSLPAGRNPAGDDIWVFIAFDGLEGFLVQRSIEIISPSSGKTLADLGTHETVASAAADDRVMDIIEAGGRDSAELRQQVLISPSDRARLGDRINDPAQTLVPNTSCATCHSFNDLTFNFHNLSYLQEMEISVAPRVKNDVKHDLGWLRADPW